MKDITVRFNNTWDDYGDVDEYEIVIFHIPDNMTLDIEKETVILNHCYEVLNNGNETEEELQEDMEYYGITASDLKCSKTVLGDDGSMGPTADRVADFIKEKYPEITWEMTGYNCDYEIDLD